MNSSIIKEKIRDFDRGRGRKPITKDESQYIKLTGKQKLLLMKLSHENYLSITDYIITKCGLLQAECMSLEELTPDRSIDLR